MHADLLSDTTLVHGSYRAPEGFAAYPCPVHHASTVLFENVAALRAESWRDKTTYLYGLHGTPTTFTLEGRLAEIEGGNHCLLAPSGLAAIALADFALLKTGDQVLLPSNVYNSSRELAEWLTGDLGMHVGFYDPMSLPDLQANITPRTRLVWAETPGSVTMEVPDVVGICRVAHENGVLAALDNTWAAGIGLRGFDVGADIVVQALTKYQSGGSDVLMGALITRDPVLHERLASMHMRLGFGVSGDDTYRVLRSLPTLKLRFEKHDAGARAVAGWLKSRPEIEKVLHPAWEDCPGHENWKRQFSGAAGLFSVVFRRCYSEAQTNAFVDALRIFKIGYSWGGPNSLCLPYRMTALQRTSPVEGQLLRFNIGLEDPRDLIADIEQALQAL